MRRAARALRMGLGRLHFIRKPDYSRKLSAQNARVAATAARLMEAYQHGLWALARIRAGGKQTVTVIHQHVTVTAGVKAAVGGADDHG